MILAIRLVVKPLREMVWKFEMSIHVNNMEKGASSELAC
jgi:hypothetical protein